MGKGDRGFAFTAWDMETLGKAAELSCRYLAIAPEVCPETGRDHIQGYVYFDENKTKSAAIKCIEKVFKINTPVSVNVAGGTAEQNRVYIFGPYEKDGKYKPFNDKALEFGEKPKQGKRTDLSEIRDAISQGKGMREIVTTASNFQQLKTAEFLLRYSEKKRDYKTYVTWLYGESGCGKTRYAFDRHSVDDIHMQNCSSLKWWQGYDAHPIVILDECQPDTIYHTLKELCDRYPCTIECKGGSRQFLATHIYITSLYHPEIIFQTKEYQGREMLRRIDEIIYLGNIYDEKI